jgi:hypothetical protein
MSPCRASDRSHPALLLDPALGMVGEGGEMGVILGSGEYTYRVCEQWAQLPDGWAFGDVAAVGIDSRDRV